MPARNLTESDWARFNEDVRLRVEHSGLYRRAPQRAVEPEPEERKAEKPQLAESKVPAKGNKE